MITIFKYKNFRVTETEKSKWLDSKDAHYYFNKTNGDMITWGVIEEEDVEFSGERWFFARRNLATGETFYYDEYQSFLGKYKGE